ncbi:MAG: CRISPR-associated endoribonuclease Cas6 [Spirosomataceae bacterium]
MRFKLILRPLRERQRLLFNYQYPLQAWLYKILSHADEAYAHFLHQQGYGLADGLKTFKHFTFSSLVIPKTEPIQKGDDCMVIRSETISLTVSFYVEEAAERFVVGLFQDQRLSIYNPTYQADFIVERVESLPPISIRQSMIFQTISPMVVAEKEARKDNYLAPTDEAFSAFFALNLLDKYRSVYPEQLPQMDAQTASKLIRFSLLSAPEHLKMRGFTIKEGKSTTQTKVIGYLNFKFSVEAPPPIIEVGYYSGFGRYNAMGCGCVEVVP